MNPASWLPLAAGASSHNLAFALSCISVHCGHIIRWPLAPSGKPQKGSGTIIVLLRTIRSPSPHKVSLYNGKYRRVPTAAHVSTARLGYMLATRQERRRLKNVNFRVLTRIIPSMGPHLDECINFLTQLMRDHFDHVRLFTSSIRAVNKSPGESNHVIGISV